MRRNSGKSSQSGLTHLWQPNDIALTPFLGEHITIGGMDFVEPTKASLMHALKPVGWVEPSAKPIIFADSKLMGIAPLYPSYGLRAVVARMERSAIRDHDVHGPAPDFASLHPGYAC